MCEREETQGWGAKCWHLRLPRPTTHTAVDRAGRPLGPLHHFTGLTAYTSRWRWPPAKIYRCPLHAQGSDLAREEAELEVHVVVHEEERADHGVERGELLEIDPLVTRHANVALVSVLVANFCHRDCAHNVPATTLVRMISVLVSKRSQLVKQLKLSASRVVSDR